MIRRSVMTSRRSVPRAIKRDCRLLGWRSGPKIHDSQAQEPAGAYARSFWALMKPPCFSSGRRNAARLSRRTVSANLIVQLAMTEALISCNRATSACRCVGTRTERPGGRQGDAFHPADERRPPGRVGSCP